MVDGLRIVALDFLSSYGPCLAVPPEDGVSNGKCKGLLSDRVATKGKYCRVEDKVNLIIATSDDFASHSSCAIGASSAQEQCQGLAWGYEISERKGKEDATHFGIESAVVCRPVSSVVWLKLSAGST